MRLLLVKHAPPAVDFDVPASEWELSAEGRSRASALAERLASLPVGAIWTSPEPKAEQTATAIAAACDVEYRVHDGLIEHRRESGGLKPWLFRSKVRAMFRRSDEVFFGIETANEARTRFGNAIEALTASGDELIVVVAHGTVISLYAEAVGAVDDGAELWDRLTLPAIVALDDGVLHCVERFPPFDFMREDDPPDDDELQKLRESGDLGRLGDALRARGDTDAIGVLEEAIATAPTPAARAVNELRFAIALQYAHRLIEALDAFGTAAASIDAHAPDHRHYLAQHHGKCLIEAGRLADGLECLETAAALRASSEMARQSSTRRALTAAQMRERQFEFLRSSDFYRGLGEHFTEYFSKYGPESASELARWLGVVEQRMGVAAVRSRITASKRGGSAWTQFVQRYDDWLELIPEILTPDELAHELQHRGPTDEPFRTTIFWWARLRRLAEALGLRPYEAVLDAADRALVETFPRSRLYRVTATAWLVDDDEAIERVALREVEDRARRAALDLCGIDHFDEQFWRDEGPRFHAQPLEIIVSDDGDIRSSVRELGNRYGGTRSTPWPRKLLV